MLYNTCRFGFLRHLLLALAALATISLQTPAISAQDTICGELYHLDATMTWHGLVENPDTAAHLAIDLHSAGIFIAEVAVPNAHVGSPRLDIAHGTCGSESASFAVANRSASSLQLAVTKPGRVVLSAQMVDPLHALGAYRVFTRLVPLEASFDDVDLAVGSSGASWSRLTHARLADGQGSSIAERLTLDLPHSVNKTEMEEIDPNPAGLHQHFSSMLDAAWLTPRRLGSSTFRVKTEMEEIDPNPAGLWTGPRRPLAVWVTVSDAPVNHAPNKTEMEEIDPNPAGLWAGPERAQLSFPLSLLVAARPADSAAAITVDTAFVRELVDEAARQIVDRTKPRPGLASQLGACVTRPGDDHHDAMACATVMGLGEERTGRLSTDWDTDADAFSFTVHELMTIEVRIRGDLKVSGALFDHSGRKLSARSGEGDGVQIIEHLEPGSYVVRVEATESAPGTYQLVINNLDG